MELVVLALVNILGGLMFGYNTGVISGAIPLIEKEWPLGTIMKGVITASILIGALVGSMIGGSIADQFGRKVGVIVLAGISLVFAPILAISPNVNGLITIRAVLGLGVGMSGIICPRYVSENSPPEKRSTLGIFFQLAITVGILLAYVSNTAFEEVKHGWRIMFGLGGIPALGLLIIAFIMPESFEWLARRKGSSEHTSLLATNEPNPSLSKKPAGSSSRGFARKITLRETISAFLVSKALYIGIVLAVAQQLTGINAFMFYAQTIFQGAGLTSPNIPTLGLGAWNVLSTIVAIPLVSRLGRRPLLIFGTMVMTASCIALGLVWHYTDGHTKGYTAIALLLLFVFAFEIGDGPLFWMVAHELFTPQIKTVGSATLNAAQWTFNILLCFFFPILTNDVGTTNVFYAFGVIGACCCLLMILFLPETRPTKENE